MKIKGLLFGLFACAALAACTNDDIVENNGKGEQEKVKANLTLVIGAATNSSRAADNEAGDAIDPGTGGESGVTDAVVLLHKEDKEFAFFLTSEQLNQQGSGSSITYEPQLTVAESGNYGVIVILNPCQEIKTAINAFINNSALPTGKNNMYDYITSYEVKATTGDNPTSAIATDNNFMMVNKVAVAANVVSNQAGTPSTTSVDVERVVSKITYMPTQDNNLYKVEDETAKYTVTTTSGWRVEDNIATYMTGMACGTLNGKNIYEHKGVYYEENGTYSGSAEHKGETLYKKMIEVDQEQIKWETTQTTGSRNWYVKLDKVALVNLSNSVYAVRHLATESNWDPSFFGTLSSSNYLMDPNTVAKNNGGTNYADYFYNVASAVKQVQVTNISDEETDDFKSYFKGLPTVVDEDKVGTTLAYCFENIVKKANQNGNYVTGVIFRGQICNVDGSSYNNNVYKYKGKFYLSLAEAAANNGKSVTEVEADTDNLTTYESGHCYYCSKDIFHHEGSETMERVIMRNNAYVLKVTGFASIGSAEIVFPTGEDQGEDTDKNFYLKLTSTILPWQVRFNNIEF
ncbi:fimbria major subunit [Phocaeicola massiliensis]|uniref:fimbria major subunit n=1 Tax=Phocaeicola massiliensis TaxID=204516 RepID=UPI001899FEE8|nr:fimbria major subunit [Phocaeicola massiliensis]